MALWLLGNEDLKTGGATVTTGGSGGAMLVKVDDDDDLGAVGEDENLVPVGPAGPDGGK